MNPAFRVGVGPATWTRRLRRSITKSVSYVSSPRGVQTSLVKKSAPVIAP